MANVGQNLMITEAPHMHFLFLNSLTNIGGDWIANTGSRPLAGAVLRLNNPVSIGGDGMLSEMGGLPIVVLDGTLNIGGDFILHHNVDLVYLMATSGQVTAGHDVYVTSNTSLTTAAAQTFADSIHHPGETIVTGNAP
jgi:hypothetical protein